MSAYTVAELEALAIPVDLDPGEAVCDRTGCCRAAVLAIPEACFCRRCFDEFVNRDEAAGLVVYDVPVDEVMRGDGWEAARRAVYAEHLRTHPGFAERIPSLDSRLDEIASDAAVALIESVGCLP
jgi:hypothetical protein